jgi:SAM-dependent methyltransferase
VIDPAAEHWEQRRTSFGSAAADYRAGRPGYPREALEWCLPPGARDVLDLAAGTGALTSGLLDLGLSVTAVEPLDDMRALIPPPARLLAGTAEAIPLPDAAIDAAFVGQAWHWFDIPRAVAELRRVLRPGGAIGLMWNLLDAGDPLSLLIAERAAQDECSVHMPDGPTPPPFDPGVDFSAPQHRTFRHTVRYDAERVAAMIRSTSASILATAEERESALADVAASLPDGEFTLSWVCEVWRTERRAAQ